MHRAIEKEIVILVIPNRSPEATCMEENNSLVWKEIIGKDQARLLPSGHAIPRMIEKKTAIPAIPTCFEGNKSIT